MEAVAITRLGKHGESISLLFRLVKGFFAFNSLAANFELLGLTFETPCRTAPGGYKSQTLYSLDAKGPAVARIGILIIDDDEVSQSALRQVLDSEGWHVRVVPVLRDALPELSSGEWSLVIANLSMTGVSGIEFLTLKELALSPAVEAGMVRARVLFLVSEDTSAAAQALLERERLPYVFKPFQFHDLLEKVSDLLMETDALTKPIRRVRHDAGASQRKREESRAGHESAVRQGRRDTGMFAKRDEYIMTEEEIAEYEKSEKEEQEKKRKKQPQDR